MNDEENKQKLTAVITTCLESKNTPFVEPPIDRLASYVMKYSYHYETILPRPIPSPFSNNFADNVDAWDNEFIEKVNKEGETNVMWLAAIALELNMDSLRELCCAYVSLRIRKDTIEKSCSMFGVEYKPVTDDRTQQLKQEFPAHFAGIEN